MTRLILTRRAGEAILVGDDIEITLLDSRNSQARIRVRAPEHVRILRAELKPHRASAAPTPAMHPKKLRLR